MKVKQEEIKVTNNIKYKYRIDHYDHFFKSSHAFKSSFFFETIEKAEEFMKRHEEAQKKWPDTFGNDEYVLVEIFFRIDNTYSISYAS